jgi:hypothetical protein
MLFLKDLKLNILLKQNAFYKLPGNPEKMLLELVESSGLYQVLFASGLKLLL